MRSPMNLLVPKSPVEIVWKTVAVCIVIAAWHIAVQPIAFGQTNLTWGQLVVDALFTGAPFVLLFFVGSWQQGAAVRALTERARFDPLSGLFNRQTFFRHAERNIPEACRGLLILLDADHFKSVNDQFGHAVGDRCIAAVGHRLRWHLRDQDIAGRIGGEEFAVFLSEVGAEHGRAIAERIGQPITFTDVTGDNHLVVTLSAGAVWIDPQVATEEHVILADEALYKAKAQGRSQLVFHGEDEAISLGGANGPRLRLENRRRA